MMWHYFSVYCNALCTAQLVIHLIASIHHSLYTYFEKYLIVESGIDNDGIHISFSRMTVKREPLLANRWPGLACNS